MIVNAPTFALQGSQKEKRHKGPEKIFEEIIAEDFTNMGKDIIHSAQETQSPRQDKPKEGCTKTHSKKMMKIKDKDKILKATREK